MGSTEESAINCKIGSWKQSGYALRRARGLLPGDYQTSITEDTRPILTRNGGVYFLLVRNNTRLQATT
jgi:hypothetical protein